MSDPTNFTPKENYLISLYKEPDKLFTRSILRSTAVLLPSVALFVYAFISGEPAYGIMAYALLFCRMLYRMVLLRRGLETISSIINKYEAKLQERSKAT